MAQDMARDALPVHRLLPYRQALLVSLGIAFTLLVVVLPGDVSSESVHVGWAGLWIFTTLGSIPLGVLLLIGRGWRAIPMVQRRGTALGFLLIGQVNSFSLIMGVLYGHGDAGPLVCLPVVYGLVLLIIYARAFGDDQPREELFP